MISVVTGEAMRRLDRHMIDEVGIPSAVLMENAAQAVMDAVLRALSNGCTGRIAVLIGPGNNGGDGLALLRKLALAGIDAVGLLLAPAEKLAPDAKMNFDITEKLGLALVFPKDGAQIEAALSGAGVIVDAILGTGLTRAPEGLLLEAIRIANASGAYRIAVDIPSGINATSGEAPGAIFRADETVTFLAYKRGLILTRALEEVGRVSVAPIGGVTGEHAALLENEQLIDRVFVESLLPERRRFTNKGDNGRALIIGGSEGMNGAVLMASLAALRAGAGLTRALVPKESLHFFSALPEVMSIEADIEGENGSSAAHLNDQLDWASAVCIGCGMGNDPLEREKTRAVLLSKKRAVVDADALNTIAQGGGELNRLLHRGVMITPHPGEMARLASTSVEAVLASPVETASGFAAEHGCTVLLKGAVSVIAAPDGRIRYNTAGNTGLAKGGSGDCLAGIAAALLAQGLEVFDAASAAAFLLGSSAETALALLKTRALTAGDVTDALEAELIIRGGVKNE